MKAIGSCKVVLDGNEFVIPNLSENYETNQMLMDYWARFATYTGIKICIPHGFRNITETGIFSHRQRRGELVTTTFTRD